MSLEEGLKARYQEELDEKKGVEEIHLDSLGKFSKISDKDRIFLEQFPDLFYITFNDLGLTSVENMPKLPNVTHVRIFYNLNADRAQ